MASRVSWKVYARFRAGEKEEIILNPYLSLLSTPNKDGRFNVYDDIKEKLIKKGIPKNEIAFIHDCTTEIQKKELFAKVRQGKIRVLFGSTFKLGAGTNVRATRFWLKRSDTRRFINLMIMQ